MSVSTAFRYFLIVTTFMWSYGVVYCQFLLASRCCYNPWSNVVSVIWKQFMSVFWLLLLWCT